MLRYAPLATLLVFLGGGCSPDPAPADRTKAERLEGDAAGVDPDVPAEREEEAGSRDAGVEVVGFGDATAEPRDGRGTLSTGDGGGGDASTDAEPTDAAARAWPTPMIIGVGNDGRRISSVDGNRWTEAGRDVTGNRDGEKVLRAVAYANGLVVAVGGACVPECTSRIATFDGRSWTDANVPAGQGRLNGVAYGNGVWVAVGSSGPVLRSVDHGKTWIATGLAGAAMGGLRAVAFGTVGGTAMFVAVGDGYSRIRSLDGLKWTDAHPSNGATDGFRSVAIASGVAVAVGGKQDLGRRMRTGDGATWTDDVVGGPELSSVVAISDRFHAFSSSGETTMHVSPDGKSWSTQATANPGSNVSAGQLGSTRLFVSRTSPATIKISADGINWMTKMTSAPGDATIHAFAFVGD